ncbi:hypothetical protein [Magnetospirillum sp. UT-4]|uniref:hypothetical protein n=1 Tax=Magnetospirillum sp. UT-4 TaxID=2681467 RepID=UPI00137F2F9B|nr:hypothetical protein [Magnetospirillum sp. UT-4]CAA7621209.1 conserved hypothetical protein [Magnetospirillum sp. UT-4]
MALPLIPLALRLAAEFAPGLVRSLAGDKAADVAGQVIKAAETATGVTFADPADGDRAMAILRERPELLTQFKRDMATLEVELEKAYLADRQDARSRDVELAKVGRKNVRADAMVIVAFVAVVAIAALLALGKVDGNTAAGGFLISVGGMFARNIGTAFDFEFGSSRGSEQKNMLLAQAPSIGGK